MERLQKVIANSGYTSRRKAEELIVAGKVKVDGIVITELGYKISGSEAIEIDGLTLKKEEKVYILMNKPRGVVTTTSDDKNRKTVVDILNIQTRVYPVGRLDYDTTGALLLTNDGELTNLLTHPKNKVEKEYLVKVDGFVGKNFINTLSKGVVIEGRMTAPAKAKLKRYDKKKNASYVELIICEGRNHQVKNMFKALGFEVLKLKRERIAFLDVTSLTVGEYRNLTIKEVKKLYGNI